MKEFNYYNIYKKEKEDRFSLTIPFNAIVKNCEIHKVIKNKKTLLMFSFLVENNLTDDQNNKILHYKIIVVGLNSKQIPDDLQYQYKIGNFIICLDTSKV